MKGVFGMIEFEYMNKEKVVAHISIDGVSIKQELFTKNILDIPIVKNNPTINDLYDFFESRIFPRERADKDDLLELLGLKEYNPYEIVKKTHGLHYDDFRWIKFKGESIEFEDIRLR